MRSGVAPETRFTGARGPSAACRAVARLLLPLLLLALPLSAAAPPGADVSPGRHLRVVASPYEPFAFQRDGIPSGLDIDLLNVVCRANRWTYELEWVPFGEVWERLRDGRADLAVGALYATPERRAAFPTTRPYLATGLGIVSLPDRPVDGPGDLRGLRVGVKAKATGEAWARRRLQAGADFTLVPFESTEASFDALLRGEVDAVLNDQLNSEFLMAYRYAGRLVVARRFGSPLLLTRDELAFPFRPGLGPTRDTFDATLRELERGGTLDRLRWQWLPPGGTTPWAGFLLWIAVSLVALALAAGLGMWLRRRRAQRRRLAESERHYRELVEQAPLGILVVRDKEVAFASPKALELLRAPTGEGVIGATAGDLVVPSDRPQITAFRLAMEAGDRSTHGFDVTALRPDGSTFPGHILIRRADLEGGPVTLVLFEDRTPLQQVEARLEDSEQARARFLRNLPGMAYHCRTRPDRRILAVSEGALALTGYWPEELTSPQGPGFAQIVHPDDRARVAAEEAEALASGKLFQRHYRIRTASGDVKWVYEQGWPVPGTGSPPAELEGFIVDETDRERTRQALDRREAEYRRVFEDSTEGIYVSTVDGRPLLANPALVRMLGYESEEELNRRDIAREGYVDPADRERFAALMERDGRVINFESRWYRKDRSVLVTLVNARAVRGPDGKVALYEGMVRDVTEERRARAALADSEARYRKLFETSYDAIFLADAGTGKLLDANPRAQELVGRTLDEIRSMNQMELHPEEERERYRAIFAAHASAGQGDLTPDLLVVHRDGRRIPVEIAGSTFPLAGRRVQVGIFRDTTDRKRTEADLLRFKFMLDHSGDECYLLRPDGSLLYANEAAARNLGYTLEEFSALGLVGVSPTLTARFPALVETLRSGEVAPFETVHIAKDGREVLKEVRAVRIRLDGEELVYATGRDITARKAVEWALQESERRFRQIFEQAPIGLALSDEGTHLVETNAAFCAMVGYSSDELRSMTFRDITHPDDLAASADFVGKLFRGELATAETEKRYLHRSGRVVWGHLRLSALRDSQGHLTRFIALVEDITARKAAEQALSQSETQYRLTIDALTDAVHVVGPDLRILLCNDTLRRWVAELCPTDPIEGRTVFEVFPFLPEQVRGEYAEVFRTGAPFVTEDRSVIGRATMYTETRKIPILEGDRVARVLTVIRDVTARHEAETALRESEERFRKILEKSPVAMVLVGADGTFEFINQKYVELFGYSREEIPDLRSWALRAYPDPAYREKLLAVWARLVEEAVAERREITGGEYQVTCKDGTVRTVYIFGVPIGDKVISILQDMTERRRIEVALRESEARLRTILEQSPISMAIVGLDGTIEYINRKAVETFGFSHEEIPTMERWWVLAYPDPAYREEVIASWMGRVGAALAEGHEIEGAEYRVTCRDGTPKTCFIFGVPVADKVFVMFQDVTDRRRAEEALRESEERYRLLIEQTGQLVYDYDVASGRIDWSGAVEAVTGWPASEFDCDISRWEALIHPEDRTRALELLGEAMTAREPYRVEYRFRRKDGAYIWVEDHGIFLAGPDGRAARMLGTMADETQRKQAEMAVAASAARLRHLLTASPTVIYSCRPDGDFGATFISQNVVEVMGLTPEQFTSESSFWASRIHPDDARRVFEGLASLRARGQHTHQYRFLDGQGRWRWMRDDLRLVRDAAGHPLELVGSWTDVTELAEAEQALRRSEEDYRGIFESAHEAVVLFDPETEEILDANRNACALYGFSREELLSMSLVALSKNPARGKSRIRETLEQRSLQGMETVHYRRDGSEILLEVNAAVVEFRGRKAILSLNRDVTERRRAEEEILRSRSRLQLILDRSPMACVVWDTQFRVTLWNPAAERLFGYPAGEALGRHPYELIVPPEARDHVDAIWRRLLEGDETAHSENENRRADGAPLLCEWYNTPLKEAGGSVVGVLSMAQDVTARRRAERQILDRNRQLSAILSASQAMTGFVDLEASARALCQAALNAFGLKMVWVGLVVPESTELQVLASAGHDEGYTEQLRVRWDESPRAQGPTGRCIKTRKPVVGRPDQAGFAPWRQAAEMRGYRSVCALPLIHEDAVRGALNLYSADPDAFGPETVEVLEIFARQTTMVIVNAALYQEARRTVEALLAGAPPDGEPAR